MRTLRYREPRWTIGTKVRPHRFLQIQVLEEISQPGFGGFYNAQVGGRRLTIHKHDLFVKNDQGLFVYAFLQD